jgi:hypothetical protein
MSDPRCNCGEANCPICTAPAHQPWTPKAGVDPDPRDGMIEQLLRENGLLAEQMRWTRWQALRRSLLIFLLTLVGGMIGGMTSAVAILQYFN